MAESGQPALYTIPGHHAFADCLAAGLLRRADGDAMLLARALVLLPNNRAVRALNDAFVRVSGGALLLPRLVAIGDPSLGEAGSAAIDPAGAIDMPPPAIDPLRRRLILARLVIEERARAGQPVEAGEAVRLAGELARTLDQLLVEEVDPRLLRDVALAPELSQHWQQSLDMLAIVLDRWPRELERIGRIDAAVRRNRLLDALVARWQAAPPTGIVCAAGISDSAPAVARLLRCTAALPRGMTVLAGLDLRMADEEWDSLGPHRPDPDTGLRRRSIETHPQFHLKLMLDRMRIGRGEVMRWTDVAGPQSSEERSATIEDALAPADHTGRWQTLTADTERLAGIVAAEFATPAEEAQGIALTLRRTLETPGRTAALVTPDRQLARRVAALCRRWQIDIDDSAGRPLAILPPGTLLLAIVEAAAGGFAPLPLLALVKHPLVDGGLGRLPWLDGVRALDMALRGPRPVPGLAGIDTLLEGRNAASWWDQARRCLVPVEALFAAGPQPLGAWIAALRDVASAMTGDAVWAGPAGREAAAFVAGLEEAAGDGPALVDPADLAGLLRTLLDEIAVRPVRSDQSRLAIYGQIEVRLQTADLMILGGLNEGVWPGSPAPDPWLAPRIRADLGLPGLDRRIGIAAHDFAQALGAPQAIVTRTRRDATAPTLASRFWLRLAAMAGDAFRRDPDLEDWSRALDDPRVHEPAGRPAPVPPPDLRPRTISVTEVDRLKADPYAFFARRVLSLSPLDPVDADPSAAWRGNAVHAILETWWKEDGCAVDALRPRAIAMLSDQSVHPMMRALWQPRLMEAIDWIAEEVAEKAGEGRSVLRAEGRGTIPIAGVSLTGRYDRIDRMADGGIGIIDYKTGKAPSPAAVRAGFSLQLGLLGIIAERGGFDGIAGRASAFEYWSLAKARDGFGSITSPVDDAGKRDKIPTADFTAIAADNFADAAGKWLTGTEPFTAKLKPEYAPYAEYDQLMRRDEWYGRE